MPVSSRIDFTGRVVAITGAARGIGRATAVALAAEGADVVIGDVIDLAETVTAGLLLAPPSPSWLLHPLDST